LTRNRFVAGESLQTLGVLLCTSRVVALALDCLPENFAESVSRGEVAGLVGVNRY
jgi:hypothetical protein